MTTSQRSNRTAVLVFHGMGIQRPMDTVRGIVNAVWLEEDDQQTANRRFWTHPEPSGNDIDLTVITTNSLLNSDRTIDFHEFYWSHLMTETKALAVLLWLFELVHKGPRLKTGMRTLWWSAAIFLEFVILSTVYLAVLAIDRFAHVESQPWVMFLEPILLLLIVAAITALISLLLGSLRLSGWLWAIAVVAGGLIWITWLNPPDFIDPEVFSVATNLFLATLLAGIVTFLLMRWWGLAALAAAYVLSSCIYAIFYFSWLSNHLSLAQAMKKGWFPWSLTNDWSQVAACLFIGVYLALNAAFLASFIGDAARYFRNSPSNVAVRREIRQQAVNTLEMLHSCSKYDRIIIVAHSLGTVVAYDMLRAYFGRISKRIPCDPRWFGADGQGADNHDRPNLYGRAIITKIAAVCAASARPSNDEEAPRPWLVTDFVTLGSPLTHAHYLMCDGQSEEELNKDFARRVSEREFPVCPPVQDDSDHRLTFWDARAKRRRFHHGAQFGLTRWINLYFPMSQLLWGDAVGGPVAGAELFREGVRDLKVWTRRDRKTALFTHTAYWNTKVGDGRQGPHIEALRAAINLEDR
jgi:pimeloyl-ACP methyl ester carboxylesterase